MRPNAEINKIVWASKDDIEKCNIKVSNGFKKNAFVALVENNIF